MKFEKYLIAENKSRSQFLSLFKFLPSELDKIKGDIWNYYNGTEKGDKMISGMKTVTDELINRLNLDDFQDWTEWLSSSEQKSLEKKLIKAIKSLNMDKDWEYDKKQRAFFRK